MVYSDFTMSELEDKFGIREKTIKGLLDKKKFSVITPSSMLLSELEDGNSLPLFSEKAKSEYLITPILREIWRLCDKKFQLFSGYTFNVSEIDKLTGVCDYLFSTEKTVTQVRSAVFCVIEAKNRSVIEGVPQAFAEMYAAQIFNELHQKHTPIIYGCVTNASEWLFLKLEDKIAYIDEDRYSSQDIALPNLLSALKYIADFYIKN
jgi:hypothetical protein